MHKLSFAKLSNCPTDDDIAESMPLLERFVVLLYHRTVLMSTAAEGCKGRAIDNIPPTQDALQQHARRAAYIGGYVWHNSLIRIMNLLSFEEYGWNADATPHWADLPQASKSLRELKVPLHQRMH